MTTPELRTYIKQQIAQGVPQEEIKKALITSGGWAEAVVTEAFTAVLNETASASVPVPGAQSTVQAPIDATTVRYAGFWIRWAASVIDGIIVQLIASVMIIIVSFAIPTVDTSAPDTIGWLQIVINMFGVLFSISYYVGLTARYGATWGKTLFGLTVVSDNLQKVSFTQVLFRETIGKFLSLVTLTIGYLMAATTKKKQALHDIVAHTVVIYKATNKKSGVGV